jgi:hypothetical protein
VRLQHRRGTCTVGLSDVARKALPFCSDGASREGPWPLSVSATPSGSLWLRLCLLAPAGGEGIDDSMSWSKQVECSGSTQVHSQG